MSEVTSSFYSKFASTCAYIACAKGHKIAKGELIRIVGERRPRNENTKRPVYHYECWNALQELQATQEESKQEEQETNDVPKPIPYVSQYGAPMERKPIIRRTDLPFTCKKCNGTPTHEWRGYEYEKDKTSNGHFFATHEPFYCESCIDKDLSNIKNSFAPIQYEFVPVTKASKPQESTMAGNDLATMIAQAVAPLMKQSAELDTDKVIALIKEHSVPQPTLVHVQTEQDNEPKDMGMQHHSFPTLLNVMSARQSSGFRLNVWLTGPAGSGKTTAANKCADALSLQFYFTGALDNPYGLLGFVDANGKTVRTQFREAYENGGVFLFDEIDGSTPSAVLPFNAALANGHCAFPDKIVDRHRDFVCLAAANTWGLGATNDYVGRLKLDAASLDRFVQIAWDIDESLETATCGNARWSARVQVIRARVRDKGIKVVVSPRASYYGAALLASGMPQVDVERLTLRKAMTDDQWASVSGKPMAKTVSGDDIPF